MTAEDAYAEARKHIPSSYSNSPCHLTITHTGDFSHWVVRIDFEDGTFLLVDGFLSHVASVRGPLNAQPKNRWAARTLPGVSPRTLTREELEIADTLYHYQGEEAMEEYIRARLKPLDKSPTTGE